MNQRQYNDEYKKMQGELQDIKGKEEECHQLKQKLSSEEEWKEKDILAAVQLNDDIEFDWKNRNMLGDKQCLFEEEDFLLKSIASERNCLLSEDFEDLKQYIKKLLRREEDCQENLSRLWREYGESKEGEDDGTYY